MQSLHFSSHAKSLYSVLSGCSNKCTTEQHSVQSNKVAKMNLFRSFNNWRRYRTTVNELSRLSAHELNDLGINRSEIAKIARKAARR